MERWRAARRQERAGRVRGARDTGPRATDLAAEVQGEHGPWVVLMPGLGMGAEAWDEVAADLARDHRVVRYDRPGLGRARAERMAEPHLHDEVAHLRRVVHEVVPDPARVWLVAHSMARFMAEAYLRSDPHRVAGLVAVDGSVEEDPRLRWPVEDDLRHALAAGLGWLPLVGRRVRSALLEDAGYTRMAAELLRLRRALPLPAVPMVLVVAARPWEPGSRRWVRRQRHLAQRHRVELRRTRPEEPLPRIRTVVVPDSGHLVMRDQPTRLAAMVRAAVAAGPVPGETGWG